MGRIEHVFATSIYRARLGGPKPTEHLDALRAACRALSQEDTEGQRWAEAAGYKGYTSYASRGDLAERVPAFVELGRRLKPHLLAFAQAVDFDTRGLEPTIDGMWVNILESGGTHTGHIHANSIISGTVYVDVPAGASAIRFEDPRLPMMMAAPPRIDRAGPMNCQFVHVQPSPGTVLLWESWLRHEVPTNMASEDRISVSFNAVLA